MSEYSQERIDSYAGGADPEGLYAWLNIVVDYYDEEDWSDDPPKRTETVKLVRRDLFDRLTAERDRYKASMEKAIREHARTVTQIGADRESLLEYIERHDRYRAALERIANEINLNGCEYLIAREALNRENK